ncbi:hypothetical protein LBMAG43_04720 [Methylococcaceae bacterium]|nr:hypothetical protein LBMAG43_04720 [Methylococcaceae bacterium]
MQLAFELPDELGQRILQRVNVQQFVQRAIEKLLLEEQTTQTPITQSLVGLLSKSNCNEADYKKYLESKHL